MAKAELKAETTQVIEVHQDELTLGKGATFVKSNDAGGELADRAVQPGGLDVACDSDSKGRTDVDRAIRG